MNSIANELRALAADWRGGSAKSRVYADEICELADKMDQWETGRYPGKVTCHWLRSAFGRIAAGEGETEVLADYGYSATIAQPDALALLTSGFNPLIHVPGQWECPKCHFGLTRSTLYLGNDVIAANNEPGEKCPNCGTPLWRVTWRQQAEEMMIRCEEQIARAVDAESRLAALSNPGDESSQLVALLPSGQKPAGEAVLLNLWRTSSGEYTSALRPEEVEEKMETSLWRKVGDGEIVKPGIPRPPLQASPVVVKARTAERTEEPGLLTSRNWDDDVEQYSNICVRCQNEFTGYKRRIVCKTCDAKSLGRRFESVSGSQF